MYIPTSSSSSSFEQESITCMFHNSTCYDGQCPKQSVLCPFYNPETGITKVQHCFSVWKNESGRILIMKKGCLDFQNNCAESQRCVTTEKSKTNADVFYCCCQNSLCNQEQLYLPLEERLLSDETTHRSDPSRITSPPPAWTGAYMMVPILIIFLVALFLSWLKRSRPPRPSDRLLVGEVNENIPFTRPVSSRAGDNIDSMRSNLLAKTFQLEKLISQGRFGTIWRAKMADENSVDDKIVAIKTFLPHEKTSWLTEQQVFELPQFAHDNILRYIRSEVNVNPSSPFLLEYWIITEYHEMGSLCDYLKNNHLNFGGLIKITRGIACGLNHLHEEISSTKTGLKKPSVAHRDFKSRNILLRSDLTPRIADFGLSLIFDHDHPPNGLGQVGTRRYMAPEVLEGAINFCRDSLIRIDMYACGLVLWEMLSQYEDKDDFVPKEYKLPYEKEVGSNPSLEDMQEIVCQQKRRPEIEPHWRKHLNTKILCDTIVECWDQDAEARLSASCISERITSLIQHNDSMCSI